MHRRCSTAPQVSILFTIGHAARFRRTIRRKESLLAAKVTSIRERALESRDAIELLSDKWRIAVLHVLTPGPLRTGDLQRALDEISPKVLTQTLRGMERDGLIAREVFPVVPPRVEYTLTPMGRSVLSPLRELCHWAKAHVAERDQSRRRFDNIPAPQPRRQPRIAQAKK